MSLQVAQVVHWAEEPGRKRMVLGLCGNCARSREFDGAYELLSEAGTAHVQDEVRDDHTLCGLDATGEGWWWPE